MKALTLLSCLTLVGCATGYQPQSFTGGYSDFLQAPDVATITYRGNGYTDVLRVVEMAALHCCDVTLQHGYRYCVLVGAGDLSRTSSFTTPGYAYTSGSAFGTYGGGFVNVSSGWFRQCGLPCRISTYCSKMARTRANGVLCAVRANWSGCNGA